ncbi:unnamed protein product [Acanthocheilonema viteae]|uniref:Uncharacterized protein n=1 Tax=Acanthocheilonema viteae TaxID=6277 RepID=A0A498S9H7_ACAVI|nr:unnamed protein product [Acanthocheilonema viteae]
MIDRGLRYAGIPERQRVIYPRQRNHFWSPVQPPPQPVIFSPPPIQPHQFQFPLFQPQPLPQYPIQQPWVPIFEFTDAIYNAKQGSSHQSQAGNWEHGETGTWEEVHDRGRKKVKRKADPPVLGTRYMISCVRHGEVDDDSMLALCSACWTWRKLPPDYFPPLINELVCSKENEGWGKCRQKYRNFDVLRNVNGNWQPTTISSAMCCDCQIRAGTEIHSLVIGKRQH